tara:strand:- start:7306 stop:11310 length:4005 start_codon:yes stop_codon:yes gene_type:complete
MAFIGDSCVYLGSPDWYIGDPLSYSPTISGVYPGNAQYGINATARIDATAAQTLDPLDDVLFYDWNIVTAPPKSLKKFNIVSEGKELLLTLDEIGIYGITLIVSGANGGCSHTVYSVVVSQPFSAAYESQQMYSVEWIWNTLPDFWKTLPQKNRLLVESLWRGVQQIMGGEYLDVLNTKDNKSIGTIQDRVIRKWLKLDLKIPISDTTFMLTELDEVYQGSTLNSSNNFLESIVLNSEFINNLDITTKATIVNSRAIILDKFSGQNFDSAKSATLYLDSGEIIENTIGLPIQIGNTQGLSLLSPVVLTDQRSFPVSCKVVIKSPSYNEVGLLEINDEFSSGFLKSSNKLIIQSGRVTSDDTYTVKRPFQIIVKQAESLGVSVGDIVEAQLTDQNNNYVKMYFDVSSCVNNYVGLAPRESIRDFVTRAVTKLEGDVVKSEIIDLIMSSVVNSYWKNRYLYNWLSSEDYLEFGINSRYYRKYTISVNAIYRRHKLPSPPDVTNIIKLTERTERFLIVDNKIITEGGEENPVTRSPLELYENLDFYLRRSTDYGVGLFSKQENLNLFTSTRFDFNFANVIPGDILEISAGQGVGSYTVVSVNKNSVVVNPPSNYEFFDAEFKISPSAIRNNFTDYVIFRKGIIPNDLVESLWCENAIYDNNFAVENNFGKLVRFTYDDWLRFGITASYKNTIVGLLLGRLTSPSVKNIEFITSIISGIPFNNYDSIVHKIDFDYELDQLGREKITRVLLEELDSAGNPTQRFNTYLIPATNELRNPDYSGISVNDSTGGRYKVGDIVPAYTSLGLGVIVNDLYEQDWLNNFDDVIDRHRFGVTLDVDSTKILSSKTIEFLLQFITEIKPAYTDFILKLYKYLVDFIEIQSRVFPKLRQKFFDNPYRLRGVADIFDDIVPDRMIRDESVHVPLSTWLPRDGKLINLGNNSFSLESHTGGFSNPLNVQGFSLNYPNQPWISSGDLVYLRNLESIFKISEVVSDTKLLLTGHRLDLGNLPLLNESMENISFYVGRHRKDILYNAIVQNISPDEYIDFTIIGDSANDLGIGDIIILKNTEGVISKPLRIINTDLETNVPKIETYPLKEAHINGKCEIALYRYPLIDRVLYDGPCITKVIHNQREYPIIELVNNNALFLGVQPGDRFTYLRHSGIITYVGLNGHIGIHPPIRSNLDLDEEHLERALDGNIKIIRNNTNIGDDDLDEHEYSINSSTMLRFGKIPIDVIQGIVTVSPQYPNHNKTLFPGDIVKMDLDNINHGEGAGIVRIISPVSETLNLPNNVEYYSTLSKNVSVLGINCYIIRQKPLSWNYFTAEEEIVTYPGNWGSEIRRI